MNSNICTYINLSVYYSYMLGVYAMYTNKITPSRKYIYLKIRKWGFVHGISWITLIMIYRTNSNF